MPVVLRRLLLLVAVAGAGFVPAPAMAAGYCTGSGVNVVVDFGSIGGGVQKGCGTGSTAAAVFSSAVVGLTRDQQYPGVVCKVEDLPANANCATMPASDAYWGLYWSDGTSGRWVYSSTGVDGLKVASGGFVAFAWQSSTSQRVPATAPSNPRPTPTPSPTPTKAPTKKATTAATPKATAKPRAVATSASAAAPTSPTAKVSARTSASPTAPTPSASASVAPVATGSATPSDGPSSASAAGPVQAQDAAQQTSGSLPWWVPVLVLLALLGGAGGVWWRRRASG